MGLSVLVAISMTGIVNMAYASGPGPWPSDEIDCRSAVATACTGIDKLLDSAVIHFSGINMGNEPLGCIALVAALVAWIASQENSFTTGAVFDISGGRATY